MKNLIIIISIASLFASCSQEVAAPQCNIGHIEEHKTNVSFIRDMQVDTIHFSFTNEAGQGIAGAWIDGQIDWTCIGFSRRAETFTVDIRAGGEECTFTVHSLDQ